MIQPGFQLRMIGRHPSAELFNGPAENRRALALLAGRQFKCLAVLDEFTRENLALPLGRSITGDDVLTELSRLMGIRGLPNFIRSDNGPEFVSITVRN